jgi:hypothetical protein
MLKLSGSLKSAQQIKEDLELNYAQLDRELESMPSKQISEAVVPESRRAQRRRQCVTEERCWSWRIPTNR